MDEALIGEPDTMLFFPDGAGIAPAVTQKKALDALTDLAHVFRGGLAGANKIAHRLMRFVRDPDRGEFARA